MLTKMLLYKKVLKIQGGQNFNWGIFWQLKAWYWKGWIFLNYSQTSLSRTRWDWFKTWDIRVFKISRVNYLKDKWLGLSNHLSNVFEILVFEIPKFNCICFLSCFITSLLILYITFVYFISFQISFKFYLWWK